MDSEYTKRRLSLCSIIVLCFTLFSLQAQIPEGITTIRPLETDNVLINQDVLREAELERYQNSISDQQNTNHPHNPDLFQDSVEDDVFIPGNIHPGKYQLQIGILDPMLQEPRINLAIFQLA
jgi:hypothetical protein